MVGRNERKLQILEYLSVIEEATARDIAEACDIEIHNARMLLARYHRYGLLTRYTLDRYGTRMYRITTRGLDRIDWLRGDADVFDEDEEDDWDRSPELVDDQELDDYNAGDDDTVDEETSLRHLTQAELEELVRREETRVRELKAEVHGLKTGDWSEFLRLRLRVPHVDGSEDL
jgi:hypothetical protein